MQRWLVAMAVAMAMALGGGNPAWAKEFKWSEHPALADVPTDGVRGQISGAAIALPQVTIIADDRGWRIALKDGTQTFALGPTVTVQDDLAVGREFRKEMTGGLGGTTLQMKDPKAGPTTLNTGNAWAVQLTAWSVKPWTPALAGQVVGTASGKIAVTFEGGHWAAGTFKDVPVRYDRHPPLCAISCVQTARYQPATLAAKPAPPGKPGKAKLVWTPTPSLDMAPPTLAAELDGKKLTPTELSLTGNDRGWFLTLQAKVGELAVGTSLRLGQTPVAGVRFAKTFAQPGDASLDVPDHTDAANTTSMPASAAYVLEITAFDAKPWDDSMRNVTTEVGHASGRIVAMWKGEDGYKNSWLAGTFADIVVEYYRDPPLCAATCQ